MTSASEPVPVIPNIAPAPVQEVSLAAIQDAYARIAALRRVLVCHPDDYPRVRGLLDSLPLLMDAGPLELRSSIVLRPGEILIFDARDLTDGQASPPSRPSALPLQEDVMTAYDRLRDALNASVPATEPEGATEPVTGTEDDPGEVADE